MQNRFFTQLVEFIVFLVLINSLILLLFILADNVGPVESAAYYIWIILPLLCFGLLFGVIGLIAPRLRRSRPLESAKSSAAANQGQ
jgi:hypothetical protein